MSSDTANYADDTARYECAPYYDKLKESDNLRNIWWFKYNNFKGNTTKCHFFLSPYQSVSKKHQLLKVSIR